MNLFSAHSITKAFNDVPLFDSIAFGMEEGERVGIIGSNGAGKTTLLRIIAGTETPDDGTVALNKTMKFEYLNQNPVFPDDAIVLDAVMQARTETYRLLKRHAEICSLLADESTNTEALNTELHDISASLDISGGWTLESEAKGILHRLGVARFADNVKHLSGGLRKRVALSKVLISDADLLILDEPTNHLDADSVQWLQDRLANSPRALLLITHDRYFLDAVATRIVELDRRKLWSYEGNFEFYLERKESMVAMEEATAEHQRNKLRTELAWLQKGAKARRSKQKSRVDWVQKLQEDQAKMRESVDLKNIKIEVGTRFAGSQLVDAVNISKSIGGRLLFSNFTYKAIPGERIGIIGTNGSGKSTLLNIIAGEIGSDSGTVKIGSSAKIGYFRQESSDIASNITVMAAVREVAEYIDTGVGRERYLSAKDLLDRFNFPARQHYAMVGTLSGGERRRLGLLRVLMGDPNILLLDEPTNDFDIATLSALEEYLQHFYGCLVIVSHDRAFLDRTVEFIYAFEPDDTRDDGAVRIKQYPGNYSAYLETMERKNSEKAEMKSEKNEVNKESSNESGDIALLIPATLPKKNSYQSKRERDRLERQIEKLEQEKISIEAFLNTSGGVDYKILTEKSNRLAALLVEIDTVTEQWLTVE